jgi:hypothetical protein
MDDIETILEPLIQALGADGYSVQTASSGGRVEFQITAEENACEECLIPPAILQPMVNQLLVNAGRSETVELRYPAGWTGGASPASH